mmetsp:Transcript_15267/g.38550  ORF Transcript_15267/g.38550 Transcript_15267/m.38550 type:complete len:84 (-) Transcript_15267:516-767(-)
MRVTVRKTVRYSSTSVVYAEVTAWHAMLAVLATVGPFVHRATMLAESAKVITPPALVVMESPFLAKSLICAVYVEGIPDPVAV